MMVTPHQHALLWKKRRKFILGDSEGHLKGHLNLLDLNSKCKLLEVMWPYPGHQLFPLTSPDFKWGTEVWEGGVSRSFPEVLHPWCLPTGPESRMGLSRAVRPGAHCPEWLLKDQNPPLPKGPSCLGLDTGLVPAATLVPS